jgi:hypothetical protein
MTSPNSRLERDPQWLTVLGYFHHTDDKQMQITVREQIIVKQLETMSFEYDYLCH